MKILKIIISLAIIVALLGFFAPAETTMQRETVINAPIEEVYRTVNNIKRFNDWSPWHSLDPENTRYEFRGPASGPGAFMSWSSDNPNVGSGSQEITASQAPNHVSLALDFGEMGTADADYRLNTTEGGTRIIWGFTGKNEGFVAKLMGLVTPLFLGPVYEQGLENLRNLIESDA